MFQIEIIGEDKVRSCLVPEDLDKVCRLCLDKNGTIELFDKNHKHEGGQFNKLLSSLGLLFVEENDDMPQKICDMCASLLNEFHFFKEQINTTQVILNVALGKVDKQVVHKSENPINSDIVEISKDATQDFDEIKCEDVAVNLINVKKEVEVVPDELLYVCSICGKTFDNRRWFMAHKKSRNCVKTPCTVCGKSIVKSRIKDHMNTHTKERPHVCEICGKRFHSGPNLYTHKAVHRDTRPHICHLCGKSYKHAPQLTDHLRTHNSADKFICDLCGFAYSTRASFKQHQYQHLKMKDGISIGSGNSVERKRYGVRNVHPKTKYCDICQKEYSTYQRLAVHMRMHTGEKPFECDVCHKKFTQNAHLTYHMRLHTGEKPYECSFCGKRFAVNGNLTQHIQIHTGDKPHSCDLCNKTFYTNSSLKKHKNIHEKIEYISSESE